MSGMSNPKLNNGKAPASNGGVQLLSKMVSGVIQTQGGRDVVKNIIADIFHTWSGSSQVKKSLTDHVILKAVSGFIDPRQAPSSNQAIEVFWSDPQTILEVFNAIPELVNIVLTTLGRIGDGMQAISVEQKAGAIKNMIHGIDMAQLGKLTNAMLKGLRSILVEQPGFLAEMIQTPLVSYFKNSDFAEIRDLMDALDGPLVTMVAKLLEILWEYPSKVLMLAASVVKLVNIVMKALHEVVGSLNPIAPEMLTELLFSVAGDLEGKPLGSLSNSINELIRQLHMGSVFYLEGRETLTTRDLRRLLREAYAVIDPVLRRKAQVAIAEEKEFMAKAGADTLREHPEFVYELLGAYAGLKNPAIRAWRRKVGILEDLPQEDVFRALSNGVSSLDTQELGDGLSVVLRLANAFHAYDPQRLSNLCATMSTCLDADALRTCSQWLIQDGLAALKPLTDAVVPSLINGLAALLSPEEASPEHRTALASLRKVFIQGQEVKGEKRAKRSSRHYQ